MFIETELDPNSIASLQEDEDTDSVDVTTKQVSCNEKNDANTPAEQVLDEVQEIVNEQELKYWNAVKENPSDFTTWTYLLQFVEQEVIRDRAILKIDTRNMWLTHIHPK